MPEMDTPVISTERLTKSYGPHRGIVNLDLTIREHEVFGFLGPNGAGKTTTIRTLLDFIRPTQGRASIFGLDCQRQGVAIRRDVGYLPGEFTLYGHLTGKEFLQYVASLRGGVAWSFVDDLARDPFSTRAELEVQLNLAGRFVVGEVDPLGACIGVDVVVGKDVVPAVRSEVRDLIGPIDRDLDRPASALAVSAALPGGDPLAAVLAAGETPSPEMVAAAGEKGILTRAI